MSAFASQVTCGASISAALPPERPDYGADWHLVYTIARHEKAVATQFHSRGIEHILPLYKSRRIWNKRLVTLDLPAFPSYVFVRCQKADRNAVISTPGVVCFVTFQGTPACVPSDEVYAIVTALQHRNAHPFPYLAVGKRVRISSGPLTGIVGVIDRMKGFRIIVSVDSITSSVAIDVNAQDLSCFDIV